MITIHLDAQRRSKIAKKFDLDVLSEIISSIVNQIRPTSVLTNKTINLHIKLINGNTCYAVFESKIIEFGKDLLKQPKHEILSYIMHEVNHFVQYYIDKVPITLFAPIELVDNNFKLYEKNITEVQSRKFDSLSKKVLKLYKSMISLNKDIQQLNHVLAPIQCKFGKRKQR